MSLSVDAVDIKKSIESCKNLQEVESIRLKYLGKKGLIPEKGKQILSILPAPTQIGTTKILLNHTSHQLCTPQPNKSFSQQNPAPTYRQLRKLHGYPIILSIFSISPSKDLINIM